MPCTLHWINIATERLHEAELQGSCHCGKVRFVVTAEIDHVRVCDCSMCRKQGALNFRIDETDFQNAVVAKGIRGFKCV